MFLFVCLVKLTLSKNKVNPLSQTTLIKMLSLEHQAFCLALEGYSCKHINLLGRCNSDALPKYEKQHSILAQKPITKDCIKQCRLCCPTDIPKKLLCELQHQITSSFSSFFVMRTRSVTPNIPKYYPQIDLDQKLIGSLHLRFLRKATLRGVQALGTASTLAHVKMALIKTRALAFSRAQSDSIILGHNRLSAIWIGQSAPESWKIL